MKIEIRPRENVPDSLAAYIRADWEPYVVYINGGHVANLVCPKDATAKHILEHATDAMGHCRCVIR